MHLDASWFRPEAIPPAVAAFNRRLEADLAGRLSAVEVGAERARAARDAGVSVFGPLEVASEAVDETIETESGPIDVHVLEPDGDPSGVYLHLHGGGWVLGAAHHHDTVNSRFVTEAGIVVVSVEYRLAPEHPHPAGARDSVAAARWLADNSRTRWGTERLLIGGESAGAHLAVLAMLAMPPGTFAKALLNYGVFDVGRTPSSRRWGDRDLILSGPLIEWFAALTFPGHPDLADPTISPLYADLSGMPSARFVVGTLDPLLDDTLFMAARWKAAGNDGELAVYSGAVHGFDYFPTHPYTAEAIGAATRWLRP